MSEVQYIDGVYDEERRLIQEAARQNRLVLFVGAGASIPSGIPSWGEAVGEIKKRLNEIAIEDDFLKIPQYYYAEYGKSNYTQLMREIFKYKGNLVSNDLHRKIFQFPVSTIVTTNYDDLLEKAAFDMFKVVDVISQDKDLAYGIADTLIIKMHGDFEHDNFVLKEDDYLKYSENFRLIEAYLKSLIARNVLLFIGYSFNDPDLKQIFSWVRDILGEDMPNSYILILDKSYSHTEESYLKRFGIVALYASQKIIKYDDFPIKERALKMMDFLIAEERLNAIQEIHKFLFPLREMKYVYKRYIETIFCKFGIRVEGNKLLAKEQQGNEILDCISLASGNESEKLKERRYTVGQDEIGKCKTIASIIRKSCIDELQYKVQDSKGTALSISCRLPFDTDGESEELISSIIRYDMDYLEKDNEQNQQAFFDDNPLNLLKQAFVLYHLGKYIESYSYLERAGMLFYKEEKLTWYFIALLNQKHLARLIDYRLIPKHLEEKKKEIQRKADKIDLEKTFQSLPDLGNEHNLFLRELYTFQIFYSLFQKAYAMAQKAQREAMTVYNLYIGTPEFLKLRQEVKECWLYITKNYMFLDYYNEYAEIFKIYARTMLITITAAEHTGGEHSPFGAKGNIQPSELDSMDIYFILQYLKLDDMKWIVSHAERQEIAFSDDAKKYLETVFQNIKNLDRVKQEEIFGKALYLFNHIDLNDSLVENVLKELQNQIHWRDFRIYGHEISSCFIYIFKQKERIEKTDIVISYLYEYIVLLLKLIINHRFPIDDKISCERLYDILSNSLYVYHELKKENFQSHYIEEILNFDSLYILSIFYPYVDLDIQEKIKDLTHIDWEINADTIRLICKLMQNKILEPNESIENRILSFADTMEDDRDTCYPSNYAQVIGFITNAWLNDCFIQKEKFADFIKNNDGAFYSWLTDSTQFDYSKFKLEWLAGCSDSLLERIRDDGVSQVKIQEAVRKQYLDGQVDKKILKRYFKYFAV